MNCTAVSCSLSVGAVTMASRVTCCMHVCYRFVQVTKPISGEGLRAAGLLESDALLLAAEGSARSKPAEADAQASLNTFHFLGEACWLVCW